MAIYFTTYIKFIQLKIKKRRSSYEERRRRIYRSSLSRETKLQFTKGICNQQIGYSPT